MNKQPLVVGDVQDIDDELEAGVDTSKHSSLIKLLEVLQEIDITNPLAKINEESIDDNNGGRIVL